MSEQLKNVNSLVEIFLLFLLFYVLLTLLKNTRGQAILNGIIFFFVVTFVILMQAADWLGLTHIKQFLQLVLSISFVASIVIFAPEIRQGLGSLASNPLFMPFVKPAHIKTVEAITEAVEHLAKNKIGAIIAIEGQVSLKEYVDKAHKIDADVSPELLRTIFFPGSPLHDGAVIIRENRVACAGSILPLSENEKLRQLGTRHRAAFGLTEETDAVCLVVSEERGAISFCLRQDIKQDIDSKTLRDLLMELQKVQNEPKLVEKFLQKVMRRKTTSRIEK